MIIVQNIYLQSWEYFSRPNKTIYWHSFRETIYFGPKPIKGYPSRSGSRNFCRFLEKSWKNLTRFRLWTLKGLAHAKISKKSVILFWLLNMTIWCKHVHRLELQKFFNFSAVHSPVRLDIETKLLFSNYWQPCQKYEMREFRLYI